MKNKKREKQAAGINRREFIKGTASLGVTAITSGWRIPRASAKEKFVLRYLVSGVDEHPEIARKAEEDLGIKVVFYPSKNFQETFLKIMTQPQNFDIIDIDYGIIRHFVRGGMLKPIESRRIKYLDKFAPIFTQGKLAGKTLSPQGGAPFLYTFLKSSKAPEFSSKPSDWMCSIPLVYNADTLGIRPDLIKRPIRNWHELLNPDFAGRAAIIDVPGIGILDAAMAIESMGKKTYKDKGNMSRAEIDQTIKVLIDAKRRGQFFDLWADFKKSVAFMSSGKVVIQSMWSPAVTQVRQMGIPCIYQSMEEGYRGWCYGHSIPKTVTGKKLDMVYEFINWYHSGWAGGFMNRQGYYAPVPETAEKFMAPYEWDYWMKGKPASKDIISPKGIVIEKKGTVRDGGSFEERMSRIACWNSQMDESRYLQKRWQDFVNA